MGAGKVFVTTHQGEVYVFGMVPDGRASLKRKAALPPPRVPAAVPAAPSASTSPTAAAPLPAGCDAVSALYQQKCALCHGPEGKGFVSAHTPDFTDPQWQASRTPTALVEAILNGKEGEGRMPAFKSSLTTEQAEQLVRCFVRRSGPSAK